MPKVVKAWWFSARPELPQGDGRAVVIGETLSVSGTIRCCQNGLHASRDPFDALPYATGTLLYQVECSGKMDEQEDKLAAQHRKAVAVRDVTQLLQKFARLQALSVAHLWDMPEVVRQYLETGDDHLRTAACAAAYDATCDTAARAAARGAAYATARAAAYDAARDAAYDAACAAAYDAACAAAHDAARGAARDAACAAAYDAARGAAHDAAAARAAAYDAARDMFNDMVATEFSV